MLQFFKDLFSSSIFNPLKRIVRYSKFEFRFKDKTFGTVLECSLKKHAEHEMVTLHIIVNGTINNLKVRIVNKV